MPKGQYSKTNKPYRDDKGVRVQSYKRFEEGKDYLPIKADDTTNTLLLEYCGELEHLKERQGRPYTYEDINEFITKSQEYFNYIFDTNKRSDSDIKLIPDVEGYASYLGITRETLNQWEKTRLNGFSDVIKIVKNQIAGYKKQLGLNNKINPVVLATDFNNNHHYTQQQKVEMTVRPQIEADRTPEEIAQEIEENIPIDVDSKEIE